MKVSAAFIAEGDESFLTIGNFDGHHETDTTYLDNGGTPHPNGTYFWEAAYYYLDDVSVVEDTSYHVGVVESSLPSNFTLYPNPNTGTFTLDYSQLQHNATLRIRNTLSQILFERQVDRGSTTLTQNIKFNKGIYLLELDDGNNCQHQYMVVTD